MLRVRSCLSPGSLEPELAQRRVRWRSISKPNLVAERAGLFSAEERTFRVMKSKGNSATVPEGTLGLLGRRSEEALFKSVIRKLELSGSKMGYLSGSGESGGSNVCSKWALTFMGEMLPSGWVSTCQVYCWMRRSLHRLADWMSKVFYNRIQLWASWIQGAFLRGCPVDQCITVTGEQVGGYVLVYWSCC